MHVGWSFTTFLLCSIIIMGRALYFFIHNRGGEARRFAVYFRPDLRYDIIGGVLLKKIKKPYLLNYMINKNREEKLNL